MIAKVFAILMIFIVLPLVLYRFFIWKPKVQVNNEDNYDLFFETEITFTNIKLKVGDYLKQFVFKEHSSNFTNNCIKNIQFWKKKNLNINRSVVLIEILGKMAFDQLVDFLHEIKTDLGKETGFIPFLYEVGMQIIVVGNLISGGENQKKAVDTYNDQNALIQSLFVIDNDSKKYYKVKSWAQYISGKYQKAIDLAIMDLIKKTN
jgi:hypothetical protein